MKFSNIIASVGFAIFGSLAVSAGAQTTTVPSGCSWTLVSQQSGPSSAIITMACKLNGASLATREQKYSAYSPATCNINWIASGYTSSGSCDSAQILKVVSACNTGASTLFQTGPNSGAFNVAAFCGTGCPYSVQPQSNYSYPKLKYTCL
jgi:hypothetical protein